MSWILAMHDLVRGELPPDILVKGLMARRIVMRPRAGSLEAYIQERGERLRRLRESGAAGSAAEQCYFHATGAASCGGEVKVPGRLRLISFPCGGFTMAFEELPVCASCRSDAKDRHRKDLLTWSEAEMWRELVRPEWLEGGRDQYGSPRLKPGCERLFMSAVGTGFALRTLLRDPEPSPRMTVRPESYKVRKARLPKKASSYNRESAMDRILRGAEETEDSE